MTRRLFHLALFFLLGLSLARFGASVARAAVTPSHGFVAYYTAARLIVEGQSASRWYDDDWFQAQIARIEPRANDIFNVNPPAAGLLLLPLAGLSHDAARLIWTLVNVLILGLALMGLARSVGLPFAGRLLLLAAALNFQPVLANFQFGQVYVLMLGLLVLMWQGWRLGRPALAGAPLGAMLALKTAGLLLWPLLLARAARWWRALGAALGTAAVIVVIALPFTGVEAWRVYLGLLPGFAARPELSVTAYQSVFSFYRRLLSPDGQWNPAPLADLPALGAALPYVTVGGLAAASMWLARRGRAPGPAFSLFAVLAVAASPVSLDYHYTLLLAPVALLAAWARGGRAWWPWLVLAAAALAIGLDLPYRSPRLFDGAWALLAYPKLYGAGLLWALAAWACLRPRPLRTVKHDAA